MFLWLKKRTQTPRLSIENPMWLTLPHLISSTRQHTLFWPDNPTILSQLVIPVGSCLQVFDHDLAVSGRAPLFLLQIQHISFFFLSKLKSWSNSWWH